MKLSLLSIILDYAGFRTLDSVVRAKEVFQQERFTIISQAFHNERALFIAKRRGLEAIAFDADLPSIHQESKVRWREYLARVKAVLDLYVLQKQPKFLGDPIAIHLQATVRGPVLPPPFEMLMRFQRSLKVLFFIITQKHIK